MPKLHIDDQQVGYKKLWYVEHIKVITLWHGEGQMRNGNLELPIPWKRDAIDNNISVVISRFNSLKSSLRKKDKVETYNTAVNNMSVKGYAEKIPEKEINCSGTRIWYLPHHPVAKKNGPIRIVFDCGSRFHG